MKPYHKNPRQITGKQYEQLTGTLAELGDLSGIVHDLNSDEIIGGNQRSRVFDVNKCDVVLTEQYDEPDAQGTVAHGYVIWNGAKYAYRQVRWTAKQCEKANIVANKAGGSWDFDTLANEFEIDELLDWGFEAFELGMEEFDDTNAGADTEPQIDRAEELRQKWGVEPGQLWQLGDHRLICGDCTDAEVVARVMGGDVPLLMVTDPPYGVEYDANWRNEAAEAGLLAYSARRIGKVENDDRADWFDAWDLFPGDVVYCWHAGLRASTVQSSLELAGFELRAQIIWRKPNFAISRGHYTYQHEPCWYAVRKGKTGHWQGPANASTVWEISLDKNTDGGHSTQKPLQCMSRPIEYHSSEFVYEPFSGSGTTIIACENLGRKCRAVEISPAYVAVALERWAQHTGRTPELIDA